MSISGWQINSVLKMQVTSLQNQLTQALNAYGTTRSQTSLVTALKLQTQIAQLLLTNAGLVTLSATTIQRRIMTLV